MNSMAGIPSKGRMTARRFDIRRNGRQSGVALILTLLVLSVLVVVVVQFSYAVKVEKTVVQNGLEDQALMLAARGVLPYLGTLFRDDAKDPNPTIQGADTLADNFCDKNLADKLHKIKIGEIDVELRVEDLERRFPLEWFADDKRAQFALETFNRLLAKLAVENPEDVGTKIANKVRTLAGKEALAAAQPGGPAAPPPPPVQPPAQPGTEPPAKRTLFTIEQLLDTEGVDKLDEILYGDPKAQPTPKLGLADFITCWPTSSININTCRGELMVALLPKQTKPLPAGAGGQPGSPPGSTQPQPIDVEALAKKIRGRRIDPAFETEQQTGTSGGGTPAPPPPPPPPPPGAPGGTGSGASKSWSSNSKAFVQLQELGQFEELKGYFPQAAAGTPGAPPAPPPPPAPGQPGQPFDFTQALSTTSRFYAVHVKATASSGNSKVVRMVVARNKQNLVSPLLVREEPK